MSSVSELVALWSAARHAIASVERQLDDALTRELGIPFTTYAVLCTIAELDDGSAEISQQHLADVLGLDKSSISRHLDAAVQAGQVSSAPSAQSRRSKSIALTPLGRSTLASAEVLVDELAGELELDGIAGVTGFLRAIGEAAQS